MFSDMERAISEIRCYTHCMKESSNFFQKNDYMGAAIYLENAARSLKVLDELKKEGQNGQVRLVGYVLNGRNGMDGGL